MIPVAIVAAALIGFGPIGVFDDALQGRPLSWDRLGMFSLDYGRKLDREDHSEIELLRKGEGSEVRARALSRLRLDPGHVVAGWIYGQTARIGKNPDEALRLLETLKDKQGPGVDYARLKTERIEVLSLDKPGEFQTALRAQAKAVWDRNPDAPEFLPLYIDILDPDDGMTILMDYAGRHKPDRIVKLATVQAYAGMPRLMSPIVDDLLKANPNDPAANFFEAYIDAVAGRSKQALALFRWLIDHSNLTDPMKGIAQAYLVEPKASSLRFGTIAE